MPDDGAQRAFKESLLEATGCTLLNLLKVTFTSARFIYLDRQNRRTMVTIIVKTHEGLYSPTVLNRCINICLLL
jgi:hypothetical protein